MKKLQYFYNRICAYSYWALVFWPPFMMFWIGANGEHKLHGCPFGDRHILFCFGADTVYDRYLAYKGDFMDWIHDEIWYGAT